MLLAAFGAAVLAGCATRGHEPNPVFSSELDASSEIAEYPRGAFAPSGYLPPAGVGDIAWGATIMDVRTAIGPLEATLGSLILNPRLEHRSNGGAEQPLSTDPRRLYTSSACGITSMGEIFGHGPTCHAVEDHSGEKSFYALAEYRSPPRSNVPMTWPAFGAARVHPFYLFCALEIAETDRFAKRTFSASDLRFCGVRLVFKQTLPGEEKAAQAGLDIRDAILTSLVARYGAPPGYATSQQSSSVEPPRPPTQLEHYYWCGPKGDDETLTPCTASVTFIFDRSTQVGVVFMATPAVYTYLWARIHMTPGGERSMQQGFRYYALLLRRPERYVKAHRPIICDACGPEQFKLTDNEKRLFDVAGSPH